MNEEKTIVYSYNKDTKIYTINDKEMQKINRKLKERFTLKQENKQLKEKYKIRSEAYNKILLENASLKDKVDLYKEVIEEVREYIKDNLNINQLIQYELLQILDKATNYKPVSLKEFDEYVASDNEELWEN